jgi:hypothetical protein
VELPVTGCLIGKPVLPIPGQDLGDRGVSHGLSLPTHPDRFGPQFLVK